jgi:glycerol-3-phosphate acyltransferase PlsX
MRPSVGRIRGIFDYEKVGGSPLLGVRGTVIITHGRARRRMIAYGMEVAARTARTGVPALIAESLAASRQAGVAQATAPAAMPPPVGSPTASVAANLPEEA